MAILTNRQREILALAAEGLQYREIAQRLWVSESTVKTTLRDARSRLKARDTANAVLLAMRAGEIQ